MSESKTAGFPHLTDDDINRAIVRAHALRSEYIAGWGRALGRWLRAAFKATHRSTPSEAEQGYPAPSRAHG